MTAALWGVVRTTIRKGDDVRTALVAPDRSALHVWDSKVGSPRTGRKRVYRAVDGEDAAVLRDRFIREHTDKGWSVESSESDFSLPADRAHGQYIQLRWDDVPASIADRLRDKVLGHEPGTPVAWLGGEWVFDTAGVIYAAVPEGSQAADLAELLAQSRDAGIAVRSLLLSRMPAASAVRNTAALVASIRSDRTAKDIAQMLGFINDFAIDWDALIGD